jgi:hypothetical protein
MVSSAAPSVKPGLRLAFPPDPALFVALTGAEQVAEGPTLAAVLADVLDIVDAATDEDVAVWEGGRLVCAVTCTGQVITVAGQHFYCNGTPPG